MNTRILKFLRLYVICLALVLTGCGSSEKQETTLAAQVQLRVAYIKVLSGLPLFVALDNGHLEDAGFEVTATPFKTSDLALAALKSGEVDMVGISGLSQALQLLDREPNYRVLGLNFSSTCLLVSTRDDAPKTIAELAGKTIGCFPGNVFKRYTREALIAEGLKANDVTIKPIPPPLQIPALKDGTVDALYSLEPIGIIAEHDGAGVYLVQEDLFAKNFLGQSKFPGGCAMVSNAYIEAHAGSEDLLIGAFRKAITDIAVEGFDLTPHVRKYTSIKSEYIPALSFEGAVYGDEIDIEPVKLLVERLQEWQLIDTAFAIEPLMPVQDQQQ